MDLLVQAFVALISGAAAWFAAKAQREAKQANSAVNHAGDDDRLYDIAAKTLFRVESLNDRLSRLQDVVMSRPCISGHECEVDEMAE